MSDTIKLEVAIDRSDVIDALSDDDIRKEVNQRDLGCLNASREDIEHLANLIARGQAEDALTFLRELAPEVRMLAPSTQLKLEALRQEPAHVHR